MLDWGCGCGRVVAVFKKYFCPFEVYGCDIDREAIAWCNDNLQAGHYATIPLTPPTAYPDDHFDAVLGYSVCTHLSTRNQLLWLGELRRITTHGAIVLLSVHGSFAARFIPPEHGVPEDLERHAVSEHVHDDHLSGVAPDGYYLGVFQTEEYTRRAWAKHFEVVDYVERGMGNYQDLVVLRNTKGRSRRLFSWR